ncbi:MAG: superoxide dismutase [Saprospirales bacterium]|nr:MAG: superoxide dismutase [Saprospirales bacterium]
MTTLSFALCAALLLTSCQEATDTQRDEDNGPNAQAVVDNNEIHTLPDLAYEYDALEPHIDAKTMEIHHTRHHQAYINNLNGAIAGTPLENMSLEEIMKNISEHSMTVRNNGGGHYNHALFWEIMSPDGGGEPEGDLAAAMDEAFGSFENFKEEFHRHGMTQFGSGWAWLIVDENGDLKVTQTPNQDNPLMDVVPDDERGTPILGVDVWEHGYYLHYQNRRGDYINAFWNVVDWDAVSKKYQQALAS